MIKKIIPFFIILSCVGCNSANPVAVPVSTQEHIIPQAELYEQNILQPVALPEEQQHEPEIINDDCTLVIKIVL